MPDSASQNQPTRSAEERAQDHQALERLAADLLPALIGKLQATGLAELEVREAGWKVRIRRPLEVTVTGRRSTDRQLRLPVPGGAAHGAAAAATREPGAARPAASAARADDPADAPNATSPAVGIFRPLPGIVGRRVRAGDRLGSVDTLGIAQEVVAPADGLVGPLLAEAGDGVEYGQPLLEMRPLPAEKPADGAGSAATDAAATVAAGAGERA